MPEPRGPRFARRAAVVAHLALIWLLIVALSDRPPCSGDFIGSCDLLLAPLLLGASVFVLLGTVTRWAGGDGPVGMLVVADLTALGLAWLNASTTGIRLAAVGAGVAILSLAIAEMSRTERLKPPP
jgi:hypothetical protein